MGSGTSVYPTASLSTVQIQNIRGPNPLCAGTCSGRNVPESNLARSDTQQRRSVGRPESPLPLSRSGGATKPTQRFSYGGTDGPIDGCTQLSTALSPVFVTLPNIPKRPSHSHSRSLRPFDPPKRPKWLQSKHLLYCSLISLSLRMSLQPSQSLSRAKIHE